MQSRPNARYAQIRALVSTAGARFISAEFIKMDGTFRQMTIQPMALKNHVKGDEASESARRAVKTRAENNPNLLNVWDVKKQAPRSVNMDTMVALSLDGVRYAFPQI